MADLQTQVMDQSQVSASDIDVAARVDQFKQQLSDTRTIRVQLVSQMQGLVSQVNTLASSRDGIYSMFTNEATHMFPSLVVKDAWAFAQTKDAPFQLYQLWTQYQGQIQDVEAKIQVLTGQFNALQTQDNALASDEKSTLDQYDAFASSVPGAPSAQDLYDSLQAIDVIPKVDEGSTIAKASALEQLTPDAADMVTLQAVDMDMNYDRQAVNASLVQNMAQPVDDNGNPIVPDTASPIVTAFKENWHLFLVGAVLWYAVFGGKD